MGSNTCSTSNTSYSPLAGENHTSSSSLCFRAETTRQMGQEDIATPWYSIKKLCCGSFISLSATSGVSPWTKSTLCSGGNSFFSHWTIIYVNGRHMIFTFMALSSILKELSWVFIDRPKGDSLEVLILNCYWNSICLYWIIMIIGIQVKGEKYLQCLCM